MKNDAPSGKNSSLIVLLLTATFSLPLLFSCGSPEVTAASNYNYKAFSTANPDCSCKNKVRTEATPTSSSTPVTTDPVPSKSPGILSTDKNYGWQSSVSGGSPSPVASSLPEEPEKKKTLIGQWIEKIGNIFKKKKSD